ncbi:MAG: glycosyltransferase [Betaproteobacteria bacterium]|nr:glycosyltransferase [Betaproteobacteria bacterium]
MNGWFILARCVQNPWWWIGFTGANILETIPTRGLHPDASRDLTNIADRPSFLMVGTLEPRKGYLQALDAFTLLWDSGVDINLVIVGREGWTDLPDRMRRTIQRS